MRQQLSPAPEPIVARPNHEINAGLPVARANGTTAFRTSKGIRMAGPEDITLFSAVDRTEEPGFFKRVLDEGNKLPGIIASKPIILGGLQVKGGEKVLDAGCGLGDDTFEIARLIGNEGHVVGVDVSETMILEARRREAAHALTVEFEVGDAQALRFADATFDACRTERMLMHVPDAERAFAEMVRVIRRGGRLSVFDFDWETQIIDSPYTQTTRQITRSLCDSFKNGWIGRRLPRLFKQHAMIDISITPQTVILQLPIRGTSSRWPSNARAAGRRSFIRRC
jgi:ubiquinone/menaquinone biosynthesis C-methylase UbiE